MSLTSNDRQWLSEYLSLYGNSIHQPGVYDRLVDLKNLILAARQNQKKVIIAGNGGSAAIASHCAVDFTKQAGVRCINFNEADLITCFANDFGYEWWLQKAISFYGDSGDTVILISSSGKSPNIINAAKYSVESGMHVVTLSGFSEDNLLKTLGQINLWVNSSSYNIVEMTHQIWLLAVCDMISPRHG